MESTDDASIHPDLSEEAYIAEFDKEWDYAIPEHFGEEEEVINVDEGSLSGSQQPTAYQWQFSVKDSPSFVQKKKRGFTKCMECGRRYFIKGSYLQHLQVHKMERALSSGLPLKENVETASQDFADAVLAEWLPDIPAFGQGNQLKALVEMIQADRENESVVRFVSYSTRHLCQCMPSGRYSPRSANMDVPLPSELRFLFHKGLSRLLTSDSLEELTNTLLLHLECAPNIKHIFVVGFLRRFADKILAFIIRCLENSLNLKENEVKENSKSEEEYLKQTVHYVAGSVVRRILITALPLKDKYEKWGDVVEFLQSYYLKGELSTAPPEEIEKWTMARDRGGLLYISDAALSFFMHVAEVAEKCEQPDGSVKAEEVIQCLHSDPRALLRWEKVSSGTTFMNRTDSQFIMDMASKLFYDTWGKGIVKRKMNALYERGFTSQGLRQKLAASSKSS